jgi:hypothetical protein
MSLYANAKVWTATQLNHVVRREDLNQLLHLDFLATCAHLHIIIGDRGEYRAFLAQRGEEAQRLLNLLQEVHFPCFAFQ